MHRNCDDFNCLKCVCCVVWHLTFHSLFHWFCMVTVWNRHAEHSGRLTASGEDLKFVQTSWLTMFRSERVSWCVELSRLWGGRNKTLTAMLTFTALPEKDRSEGQWVQAEHHRVHYPQCMWAERKLSISLSRLFWSLQIDLKAHLAVPAASINTCECDLLMVWLLSEVECYPLISLK